MTYYQHLFSGHQLHKDVLRGLNPAKLRTLHEDLHAGKYPHAKVNHAHNDRGRDSSR